MLIELHSLYTYTKRLHFTLSIYMTSVTIAPYSITYKANVPVFKKIVRNCGV